MVTGIGLSLSRRQKPARKRWAAACVALALAVLTGGRASAQTLFDPSFETPEAGTGMLFVPTVTDAVFAGNAGVAGNGNSLGFAAAPDGDQVGFIQTAGSPGSITLTVRRLVPGTTYQVRVLLAKRPAIAANPITISFNGSPLGTFTPPMPGFEPFTSAAFTATAATGTLTFTGGSTGTLGTGLDSIAIFSDPAFRVGEGVPITPTDAAAQLGAATAHTNGPGYAGRSTEVKSLARALGSESAAANPGAYVDQVHDYVRNTIEIEPMFGSAKGPLGTILDRRGTAFDQAQLFVELLAEGGISADYQFGDITMSAATVANWIGATRPDGSFDQIVVEQMLADGGIPFTPGANITFAHLWVRASIGGVPYLFDPAFKTHDLIPNVAVATAMSYSRTSLVSAVESGAQSGSVGGIPSLRALNAAGLDTHLNTLSGNLLTWIETNKPVSDVDDILGGARIARVAIPAGGWRQTSLPYGSSVRATWTAANGIPDQYRTRLRLRLEAFRVSYATGGDPLTNLVYFNGSPVHFTDEIYGRRFWIDAGGSLAGFQLDLKLDDLVLATATATQPGSTRALHPALRKQGHLSLSIDHPYAAHGGAYLDRNAVFLADYVQSMTVVLGLGSVSDRLAARHGPEMYGQRPLTVISGFVLDEGGETILDHKPYFRTDHSRTRIADAWMTQASRMTDLQARVGGGYHIQHHLLGVSFGQTEVSVKKKPNTFPPPYGIGAENVTIAQDTSRLSVDSAVSIRSRTAGASATGMRQAIAAASAALEGSIFEQQQNQVDSVSTASRLAWANNFGSGAACQNAMTLTCAQKVPLDFALLNAGNAGQTNFIGGNYTFGTFNTLAAARNLNGVNHGLGPGINSVASGTTTRLNVFGRGYAHVAFNATFTEFYHEVRDASGMSQKGGGGAISQDTAREFDPKKAADILKDTFTDRSSLHGVSLANGQLSYTPAADLIIGGEGAGALSFQRFFSGGEGHSFGLPDGWTHNWDYSAELSSSGAEALGARSVRAAAPSIAAFQAMQDIYGAAPGALANQIEALLIADWWRRQMSQNILNVRRARSTEQFVSVPSGAASRRWLAPDGNAAAVAVSGAPSLFRTSTDSFIRSYQYNGMGVTWTGGSQEQILFTLRLRPKNVAEAELASNEFTGQYYSEGYFLPTTMTDTAGRTIVFGWYGSPNGNALTSVTNGFGRSLTFTYQSLGSSPTGAYRPLLSVADNAGQSVSFTYGQAGAAGYADQGRILTHATLPGGRQEVYDYVANGVTWGGAPADLRPMHTPRLREIYDPGEMARPPGTYIATSRFSYDSEWRVATLLDAEATHVPGTRPAWKFLVADSYRGARIDPLGASYQVYYDDRGRADRYLDELGRVSLAGYDSWGRVKSRTAPELDRTEFSYDLRSNVTGMTRVAKPGSPSPTTLTATASYDPLFNAPITVSDFNTNVTNLSYVQSGNGRGEILQALRPAVGGVRPQYDYTYTASGLVDTVTTKIDGATSTVTKNYYDAASNLTMSVVDNGGLKLATCYEYDALGNRTAVTDGRAAACAAP